MGKKRKGRKPKKDERPLTKKEFDDALKRVLPEPEYPPEDGQDDAS